MKFNLLAKLKNKNLAFLSLTVIFGVLLLQTAILMFAKTDVSDGLSQMDIVFRTTLSSLFGFFMSSAAMGESSTNEQDSVNKNSFKKDVPKKIGFVGDDKNSNEPKFMADESKGTENKVVADKNSSIFPPENTLESKRVFGNLRIIILSVVCIFCLTVMLFVRNFSHLVAEGNYVLLTMSLYRDIISSSTGAIIGLARGGSN